jgi:hypothetical protein
MRIALSTALAVAASLACAEPLTVQLDDRGVATLSDGGTLARAVVMMHGPGWTGASNEGAKAGRRQDDTVQGSLELPPNCVGRLDYSVTATATAGKAELAYALQFSERTQIQGAYVSFLLPVARFEGRTATLLHAGTSRPFPRPGESFGQDEPATALVADLGDGKALVIASHAGGYLHLQDNRQYGGTEYEARFYLFGAGPSLPGFEARRAFTVAVVPAGAARDVAESINPAPAFDPDKPYALLLERGSLRLGTRRDTLLEVRLAMHGVGWAYSSQDEASVQVVGDDRSRSIVGRLPVPAADGQALEFVETVTRREDLALGLTYRLHFPDAVRLNGYQVSFSAALSSYAGAQATLSTADGERVISIPAELGENFLFSGPVSRIVLAPDRATGFSIEVDQPSALLIQDNRGWGGDTIEFRFNFRRQEAAEQVPAGETVERTFTLRRAGGLQAILDDGLVTSQTDTSDWFAYSLPWDSAPIDVSFLNHRPAGKYGFVTVKDGRFVLADSGAEIRFWGTCFSAGANFPSHEQAEKIARRLARFGVNIVRTHHADAPWAERHFFPAQADNTRTFDAENLDRFDYLVSCLKNEGIYVYLDQLVNRRFKSGDGVDAADKLEVCAKPYSNFDPKLIELQQEFSRNLWTHVNPYTGLAYKDDPAIALMEFANENDLFTQQVELEPYRTRFEQQYRSWAAGLGIGIPPGPVNFRIKTDAMMRFLVEVQQDYYRRMERYLRDEVGVRVPLTGSNWSRNAALLVALRDMDYTDSHTYWNHPQEDGSVGNTPMTETRGTIFDGLAFQRLVGKPFFVSEWDEPWPNEWRAELPVWMAAIAAFQAWNGLTVYTYRHSASVPVDSITGSFETFNDPARFGLFAHAALLFRRGDVAPAAVRRAVVISGQQALGKDSPSPWSAPAYRGLSEVMRVDTGLFAPPTGYDSVVEVTERSAVADDVRTAAGGQIRHAIAQGVVTVDSPRTQALIGNLGAAGTVLTHDLQIECVTGFATIALSSLSDTPIAQSNQLLLTAVGRAENSGFRYNLSRQKRIAAGTGPILVEPVTATVAINNARRDLKVQALAATGEVLGDVPAQSVDGHLTFRIGLPCKTIYYRIAPAMAAP